MRSMSAPSCWTVSGSSRLTGPLSKVTRQYAEETASTWNCSSALMVDRLPTVELFGLCVGEDLPGGDRIGGGDEDAHALQLQLWLLAARVVRRDGRVQPVALQQACDQLRFELAGHDRHRHRCIPSHLVLAIPVGPAAATLVTVARGRGWWRP